MGEWVAVGCARSIEPKEMRPEMPYFHGAVQVLCCIRDATVGELQVWWWSLWRKTALNRVNEADVHAASIPKRWYR